MTCEVLILAFVAGYFHDDRDVHADACAVIAFDSTKQVKVALSYSSSCSQARPLPGKIILVIVDGIVISTSTMPLSQSFYPKCTKGGFSGNQSMTCVPLN